MVVLFFVIGIDGGGMGMCVVLVDWDGCELVQGCGGLLGFGFGIEWVWVLISVVCVDVFMQVGFVFDWLQCVFGCGLVGVNNVVWFVVFCVQVLFGVFVIESDVYMIVVGVYGGVLGFIVVFGIGSIVVVFDVVGVCWIVGGFGFLFGDEVSGVWFGVCVFVYV